MLKGKMEYIMNPERTQADLQAIILEMAKQIEDMQERLEVMYVQEKTEKPTDREELRRYF